MSTHAEKQTELKEDQTKEKSKEETEDTIEENMEETERESKKIEKQTNKANKGTKKRKGRRLDPVLATPLTNWRTPCGLGASKSQRASMNSILAGLTKRDEDLAETSKEWEQEKQQVEEARKKRKEEKAQQYSPVEEQRVPLGRTAHDSDSEDVEDPASHVEELFEDADTVVLFTKRLFMKNLYQHVQGAERKQHTQLQSQQRREMIKQNSQANQTPAKPATQQRKVSPDKLNLVLAFQKNFQRQATEMQQQQKANAN